MRTRKYTSRAALSLAGLAAGVALVAGTTLAAGPADHTGEPADWGPQLEAYCDDPTTAAADGYNVIDDDPTPTATTAVSWRAPTGRTSSSPTVATTSSRRTRQRHHLRQLWQRHRAATPDGLNPASCVMGSGSAPWSQWTSFAATCTSSGVG